MDRSKLSSSEGGGKLGPLRILVQALHLSVTMVTAVRLCVDPA